MWLTIGLAQLKQALRCAVRAGCRLCGKYKNGLEVCPDCAEKISRAPWGVSGLNCGSVRIPVLWREAYGGPLTELIYQSKYHGQWAGAQLLGRCMGRLPRPWLGSTPIIIPIPLSGSRLGSRGYNQSLMIAREAARCWGTPVKAQWLRKTQDTMRQATLARATRQSNLRHAFLATQAVCGQRVILIDDIMTSGATLREAVRAIRDRGGEVIGAAVIARVGPGHHQTGRLTPKHHAQRCSG